MKVRVQVWIRVQGWSLELRFRVRVKSWGLGSVAEMRALGVRRLLSGRCEAAPSPRPRAPGKAEGSVREASRP